MKYVRPIDPVSTWHLLQVDNYNAAHYISSLLKTNKTPEATEQYWFPTPKNPGKVTEHTPLQKRIYQDLLTLQNLDQLNPQTDPESRETFLEKFDWKDSMLNPEEIASIETLLVEFHDLFARQSFDIGMNEGIAIKLAQKDGLLA